MDDNLNILNKVISMGAAPLVTFLNKDNNLGVFFHDECDKIHFDYFTVAMLCTLFIRNYINALPDAVQIEALENCYKVLEDLRNMPSEEEKSSEEIFGSE